jgi:hypothetical protein
MITVDSMMAIEKADLPKAARALGKDDIMLLVKRVS